MSCRILIKTVAEESTADVDVKVTQYHDTLGGDCWFAATVYIAGNLNSTKRFASEADATAWLSHWFF